MVGFSGIGYAAVTYGLLIPFLLLQFFALLFIPSMMVSGAKASEVGKAVLSYLLQTIGILLMTGSGISAVYSVATQASVNAQSYLALLFLFVGGGVTFLWFEHQALSIDRASRSVPFVMFWSTFKAIGFVTVLLSFLYLLLTAILLSPFLPADWWVMPSTTLFYGVLVSWCTRGSSSDAFHFQTNTLAKPPTQPMHPLERMAPAKTSPSVVLPKKILVKKKGGKGMAL